MFLGRLEEARDADVDRGRRRVLLDQTRRPREARAVGMEQSTLAGASCPRSISLIVAYNLWRRGWDTALSAIAIAAQSRTLSATDAATHTAVIAVEREHVTRHFTHLLGRERLPAARATAVR